MSHWAALALSATLVSGCAGGYANQGRLERANRSPHPCYDRCQEAGMRMTGYVFMDGTATACVCAMPAEAGATASADNQQVNLAGATAAAELLRPQQQAGQAAQQQQQQAHY